MPTPPPARIRPHLPQRPIWLCQVCGHPWPCATARLSLRAEYTDSHVALSIYLCGLLHDAIDDLYRLNPYDGPSVGALFDRFVGWIPRRNLPNRPGADVD